MYFPQICAFQWTKVKWSFGRVFYHFTIFGSNVQKSIFEENKRFNCSFYQIEVQVTTNPSSRLEKHQILIFIAYDRFFLKCSFSTFTDISGKLSVAHTKIIVCVLFHVNMTKHITA